MKDDHTPATTLPTLLAAVVGALDAVDDHVVVVDERGRVLHVNVAWQRFAHDNGWEGSDWIGMDYIAASTVAGAGTEGDPISQGVREVLEGRRARFGVEYDCHAPDELRWFSLRVTKIDVPGVGAVITHTDITHRRMAERRLERLATRDELTGLANRPSLQESVAEMLREEREVGLIVVTLEDPRDPGRTLADDVVSRAAALLSELFPSPAITARYGQHQLVVAIAGMQAPALEASREIVAITMDTGMSAIAGLRTEVAVHTAVEDAATPDGLDRLVAAARDEGRTAG
ncbi:GGDEF domain-containing protein [Patulibacter minatonensis]|uniref:GGDEF domain-containing protein n=1 Tax=Patulibacter minatonensis TaxID=298163 RepID=UPI0004797C5F|nr:PAS domain-containing protein [Patulibacter minatonensis]